MPTPPHADGRARRRRHDRPAVTHCKVAWGSATRLRDQHLVLGVFVREVPHTCSFWPSVPLCTSVTSGAMALACTIRTWFSSLYARIASASAASSFWPAVPLFNSVTSGAMAPACAIETRFSALHARLRSEPAADAASASYQGDWRWAQMNSSRFAGRVLRAAATALAILRSRSCLAR
jgi:hypothetical protein